MHLPNKRTFYTCLIFGLIMLTRMSAFAQTVRGTVIDQQSEIPLVGVAVELLSVGPVRGTVTDVDGAFVLEQVPPGRQVFRFSYLGYEVVTMSNVVVTAGKDVVLTPKLVESVVQMNEVVVVSRAEKNRPNNDMAALSARSFNLEEVNRFSGGRNDVARLAGNYAGVSVADDSRNDLVIRGNSPTGVLWRLEGAPIPNPNHFATLGTTGGPVSALNPNLLRSSDFLTSAFPAEYGNALAGVFDVGFRSGNRDRYEFTAQLAAFSGLEAMAEGPLSGKGDGSFVAAYRHSFVEIADKLGIPVGTNATPNYRDLSFKVDFGNGPAGKFSLFGIGGTSKIDFLGNDISADDLFANPNEDAYARSQLGIVGLRHNILVGRDAYVRTVASFSTARTQFNQDNLLNGGDEKLAVTDVDDITDTYTLSSFYNKKFNARFTLRTGLLAQHQRLNTRVLDRDGRPDLDNDGVPDWITVRDFNGGLTLLQGFAQGQYRFGAHWTLNAGLHGQYLDFTGDAVLEPRVAVTWQFQPGQAFNLGYGLHHQTQPLPVFFFEEERSPGVFSRTNADLGFTRSQHLVAGYDLRLGEEWRLKAETYYQFLDRVPVETVPGSFSLLNAGADFIFPEVGSLVNKGTGRNYGAELTLEKFFSRGYYGLFTASVFDSKYRGSDDILRNTAFNNGYIVNVLAGKEFRIGPGGRNALSFDTKLTTAGGRYYTPVDLEASRQAGEEVLRETDAYSERYNPYFRLDVKMGVTFNHKTKKLSQQFFLDLQNVTNHNNIFARRYNELTNEINDVYQSGFFPDILWRLQF